MKNLVLVSGLALALASSIYACGSDVQETTSTTAAGGSGATGGMGGAPTASSSSSSATTGGGGFGSVCEEACFHLEQECQIPNACALAQQLLGVDISDCSTMEAECTATCIADADCGAIASLIGQNPDPALSACVFGCQGDSCFGCILQNCQAQAQACQNDASMNCPAFVQCLQNCDPGDEACINQCAATNDSPETQALLQCAGANCQTECLGQGGGGGGGGAGGSGGGN